MGALAAQLREQLDPGLAAIAERGAQLSASAILQADALRARLGAAMGSSTPRGTCSSRRPADRRVRGRSRRARGLAGGALAVGDLVVLRELDCLVTRSKLTLPGQSYDV